MTRPVFVRALLTSALAVTLAACGGGGTDDAAGGTGEPQSGGTLRILDYLEWSCLAPPVSAYKDSVITNQLYDRLTYQDPETLEITPWVATDWTVNDEATEYVFTLRDDITFSDGTALTPEVVKANYDQLGLGAEDLGVTKWNWLPNYEPAEVTGDNEITFHFSQPSVGFLQATSNFSAGLLAEETLGLSYDERCQGENVIGTGPFVFDSEDPGKRITLKRRDDYAWSAPAVGHSGPAYLDELQYTLVPEASVRVGSLLAGQADTARGILPTDEELVTGTDGYHLDVLPSNVANQLAVYPDTPGLEDPRVRRALNLATDRQQIHDTLLSDSYELPTSNLGRRNTGYVDHSSALVYDPDQANGLLDDAGWTLGPDGVRTKDGQALTLPAYTSPHHITSQGILELLAEQWKQIGVALDIRPADLSTFTTVSTDPAVNAFYQTSPTRVDPDILRISWDSTQGNLSRHEFPELDELVRAQNAATDPEQRKDIANQVQDFIFENGLTIPLYEDVLVYGTADYVHDVAQEPQGRPFYLTTWVDQ